MKFKRLKESYNSDSTNRLNSMNEKIKCRDKFKKLETISKNSLKESSDNTYYNSVIQDLESIESFLRKENFTSFDVSDYDVYPMQTSAISFVVEGDWKHEHQLFKNLLHKWSQETGRDIFKIDEEEVGDSDSDWYTSIYKVFITKDKDTMNTLNSMRGLFEAKDSYFTKSNDELSYEALSALRNFKKTAEYGDSIKLDINGEKVNIQKEYDGWYLTCSKTRIKGPYKYIEATVKDLANGRFDRQKEKTLGEAVEKNWVVFFDEDGVNRSGSDGAHAHNLTPGNIERRIKSGKYHVPKWAKSYVILSDYKFMKMDYDEVEKYNKRYGKSINESLNEDSNIEKYDPNINYADRYRVKVANCKCPLCNSASLKLVDYVDDYVVCDNCGAEFESAENPNGSITFKTWEYDYTPDPNHENDFEISYGKDYDPDFKWDEDDLELVSDELNAGQWLESLKEEFSMEEKRRDFIKALEICQAYDPYTEYIENGRQQKYKEKLNYDLNKEFKEIMSKYGINAYSVPKECTYAYCRTDRDFIDALKNYVSGNRMTSKEIVEALNELDNKAINEDTTFYDLKNLYEANELKAEDRRRLADAIRNGDDPVLIATFLSSKLKDDVDEDFIDADPLDDDKQLLNEYTIDEDFDEDLGFLEDYLDDHEIPDVISETEIVETEMPSQGEDIGLSDMILDSIQSSAEKIREYNSLSANLGEHEEDLKDILEDISVNENETLGKLQSMLKVVSPNAENIMDGAVEAEELIEVE